MTINESPALLINSDPPLKQIPALIEWWVWIYHRDSHFRQAEILQIESAHVEDNCAVFSPFVSPFIDGEKVPQTQRTSPWLITIFIDNKKPERLLIISASAKTGKIVSVAKDAKGNLLFDSKTGNPKEEIIYSNDISVYLCLPLQMRNPRPTQDRED